jgi:tRNA dimethylallyltransferase
MTKVFFLVGPTATGKSELAAEVASRCDAEIVSADAFQIYRGLDVLTAKPDAAVLAKAPHHLIGALPVTEELNAEKFRKLALNKIDEIHLRGKLAIVVGGSGLYIKALTHGLARLPSANAQLRAELNQLGVGELHTRLMKLDPETARKIDTKNPRRLVRAIEIASVIPSEVEGSRRENLKVTSRDSSTPLRSAQNDGLSARGVFVFRERDELYARIDRRVIAMFAGGVVDEVRALGEIGETGAQTLGLRPIRDLVAGKISEAECIAAIQQATRRYAKRQLTWFRRQTSFEPLNLSSQDWAEAISGISQRVRALCAAE